jgi:oligopeptide/dipeptide ABC transporter ATP-binding protein
MSDAPVLSIENLTVTYKLRRTGWSGPAPTVYAVRGIDLNVLPSETLGLVGESGCGKTTTGRAALGLVKPVEGTVAFRGQSLDASAADFRRHSARREMQIVFQDPFSSLDPTMRIEQIVGEPLEIHEKLSRAERRDTVRWALEQVGLRGEAHLGRFPAELSGGQRQRVAIARAIVLRPAFIVFDEAVSALDVSSKSQVIELIQGIQQTMGASYLFISHDLATVRHVSHRVAVMYSGKVVETGPSARVCSKPAHPYTFALLSAIPVPDPKRERQRKRLVLAGEPPSPLQPPSGCPFHHRCPFVMEVCRTEMPALTPVDGGGEVACHLQTTGRQLNGRPLDAYAEEWAAASSPPVLRTD